MAEDRLSPDTEKMKEMVVNKIEKLVHENLKKELEKSVRKLASQVIEEVKQVDFNNLSSAQLNNNNNYYSHKSHEKSQGHGQGEGKGKKVGPPSPRTHGKVFMARDSLLTELLEVPHIRTIYHIFVVILIILFLNTVIYDLVDRGSINVGMTLVTLGFGKLGVVAWIWSGMQLAVTCVYPLLSLWAYYRQSLSKSPKLSRAWDLTWLCLLVGFQCALITQPVSALLFHKLPIVSSLIVVIESVRFLMKVHAFVRSVVPRARTSGLPPFSCYLYFLFAPTLVYRDSYPRTSHIRWGVVAARLLEIMAIIFYISFLCERFLLGTFSNYGKPDEVLEAKHLVVTLFNSMLPGLLTYVCGFYLLLHSWLNATAEVLTFADRQFYMDWWNQWSYAKFYRTWNMVVHDWLHTYIYQDMLMLSGHRLFSTLSVFVISAIFHEFILSFAFGFFYPVLLLLFGVIGVLVVFLTRHANPAVGNIFMWWSLAVGNGILWCLYSMEFFARKNCPATHEGLLDTLLPRSWSCTQVTLHPDWKFQNPFDES